ncbi:cyclophilin-like fold protein [Candidatus Methanomassiliicoccus intestinalis]|jgi:hypothetical protein|uniref:Cyclophilin TM1367-like domain-containing protein n=1 Tax=Candidatus Methanomassiliicoccus intestinalis TaxID=1406512 RepID=A0A8J8PG57_9ARCH|nr:MAG: hypothetical protein A3207_03030 [Candidatus Methanomassiliicoccus intestinalis]
MGNRISFLIGNIEFEAELNDSDTANAVWLAAPFTSYTNLWGGEIYFEIPVKTRLENGRRIMTPGEIAYWPEGQALCIFFGPTPVGKGDKPVAISDVTPIGKVDGPIEILESVGDRTKVTVRIA